MSGAHRTTNYTSAIRTAALLLAFGVTFAVSGCASDTSDSSATNAPGGAVQELPPVIADLSDIDGTTVQVAEDNGIDLTGDDQAFTDWTAEIADTAVLEFVPGSDDGSVQMNPGLDALAVGETEVTLNNSTSGDSVTFTVEVTTAAQ